MYAETERYSRNMFVIVCDFRSDAMNTNILDLNYNSRRPLNKCALHVVDFM